MTRTPGGCRVADMQRRTAPMKDARITVRITAELKAKIVGAAAADGVSPAEWLRALANDALRETKGRVRR